MSPDVVYAKTGKGRDEIATRGYALPLKLRAILILVDGRRRVKDLRGQGDGGLDVGLALAQLEEQGFIERVGAIEKVRAAPRPEAAPEPAPGPSAFETARAMAVRLLQEAMGRDAGAFAPRLAACGNGDDLLAAVERYAIVIGSVRDKGLGEDYLQQVRAALQGA